MILNKQVEPGELASSLLRLARDVSARWLSLRPPAPSRSPSKHVRRRSSKRDERRLLSTSCVASKLTFSGMRRGASSASEWDEWSTPVSAPAPAPAPAPAQQGYSYQAPSSGPQQSYEAQQSGSMQAQPWQQQAAPAAAPPPVQTQPYYAPDTQPGPAPTTGYTGSVMMPALGAMAAMAGSGSSGGDLAAGAASMVGQMMGGGGGASDPPGAAMQQAAAGMAMNYLSGGGGSQQALNAAEKRVSSYTGSRLAVLRYYFEVNNRYVLHKLRLLLLPYRHKDWERKGSPGGGPRPPSEDVNAPDLYLPLMAYVTYAIVVGYVVGSQGRFAEITGWHSISARFSDDGGHFSARFTPELLGMTASSGVGIMLLEVILLKLGFYLLQPQGGSGVNSSWLDLASISGYKFVGAVLCLVVRTFLGLIGWYVAIATTGAGLGTFMVKTLRHYVAPTEAAESLGSGMGSPGRKERCVEIAGSIVSRRGGLMTAGTFPRRWRKRENLSLLGVAALQPLFFWYLTRV